MAYEGWTDEKVEKLKEFVSKSDLSASDIAARLGGLTRNAVIGKVHRLKLPWARASGSRTAITRARSSLSSRMEMARRKAAELREDRRQPRDTKPKRPPSLNSEPLPMPAADDIARVKLADLESHHCRYPIGDPKHPSFGFCGLTKHPGKPYCVTHVEKCFAPTPPPRAPITRPDHHDSARHGRSLFGKGRTLTVA